jgi:20S proteasome alpha/beta subunit
MAAESKTVTGDTSYNATKIFRIRGDVVGAAGDTSAIDKFLKWYRSRKDAPEFKEGESFAALALTKSGLVHYEDSVVGELMKDDYFAVGTGAIAALVAMDRGADLVEAVEAAIRRDGNSGGPIDVLTLDADT